jgi:signal transduction histidine kinase
VALFPAEFSWVRYLASARALLAAVGLFSALEGHRQPPTYTYTYIVFVVYLMFGLILVVKPPGRDGIFSLLALFADAVYFLILAAGTTERSAWLLAIFFLYLIVAAVALHRPREVALVAASATLFCAAMPGRMGPILAPTVVVGGVIGLAAAMIRKRSELRCVHLSAEVAQAKAAAVKAVEAERLRIASDFHDGPLQNFISMQMRLDILRKLLERDRTAGMEELQQMQALAQAQVRDLRAFLHSMRPVEVDGENLVAGIRRTAEHFQKESGIPLTLVGGEQPVSLPPDVAQETLQMVREALHNIQKHAGATRVAVAMERSGRTFEISIDDNGQGFNFVGVYTLEELDLLKIGPASLKRRARSVNAEMTVDSRPGRGAGIKIRIPVQ